MSTVLSNDDPLQIKYYTAEPVTNEYKRMSIHTIAAIMIALTATSGITAQETQRESNTSSAPKGAKYLETDGERKLEVVYKKISGKDSNAGGPQPNSS